MLRLRLLQKEDGKKNGHNKIKVAGQEGGEAGGDVAAETVNLFI